MRKISKKELKKLLIDKEMTLKQLAEMVGVNYNSLRHGIPKKDEQKILSILKNI